jgi:hypothetical protein
MVPKARKIGRNEHAPHKVCVKKTHLNPEKGTGTGKKNNN